jgi:signal transduction histidine kinase
MRSATRAENAHDQPLAPKSLFISLLRMAIAIYFVALVASLINTFFNSNAGFYSSISHIVTIAFLLATLLIAARSNQQRAIGILTAGISSIYFYRLIAGQMTFISMLWIFVILLIFSLTFATQKNYKRLCIFAALFVISMMVGMFISLGAFNGGEARALFQHETGYGYTFLGITLILYFVQDLLFKVQKRERAAMDELARVQQHLEQTVQDRTQALTQANRTLSRQNTYLTSLHETTIGIINHLDLRELMTSLLEYNCAMLDVQSAAIYLVSADGTHLERFISTGTLDEIPYQTITREDKGFIGQVWRSGQAKMIDDYATWSDRKPDEYLNTFHASIAAPLLSAGKVQGVIAVMRNELGRPFTPDEFDLQQRLAQLASVAHENAQMYAALLASEQLLEMRVEERTRRLRSALEENEALREKAIEAATSAERSRIARELHDSVSQALYGISLGARTAESIYKAGGTDLGKPLSYILALAEAGLAETRALIFEIQPESLKEQGLLVAIQKHTVMLHHRHGLQVVLNIPKHEPAISLEVKYALYRVMQEATHNTFKHANAHTITITLRDVADNIVMVIEDDGRGFDTSMDHPGHNGLRNMTERIQACRGTIHFNSQPGKGTRIEVSVPCQINDRALA